MSDVQSNESALVIGSLYGEEDTGPNIQSLSPADLSQSDPSQLAPEHRKKLFRVKPSSMPLSLSNENFYKPMRASQKEVDASQRKMALTLLTEARHAPIEQTAKYRIPVAWRILKRLLALYGRGSPNQFLPDAMNSKMEHLSSNPNPWTFPDPPNRASPRVRKVPEKWTRALVESEKLDPKWLPHKNLQNPMTKEWNLVPFSGLPYMPPSPPPCQLDDRNRPLKNYDPARFESDPLLHYWCHAVKGVLESLQMKKPTELASPKAAILGTYGMDDPVLCRWMWPSPQEIVEFEEIMVEQARKYIVEGNKHTRSGSKDLARVELASQYGLSRDEANDVCKMAEMVIVSDFNSDRELNRAIMASRLEEFIDRCKTAGDLSREAMGMRQLSNVLGLTRGEGGSGDGDLVEDIRRVAEAQEAGELPAYDDDAEY